MLDFIHLNILYTTLISLLTCIVYYFFLSSQEENKTSMAFKSSISFNMDNYLDIDSGSKLLSKNENNDGENSLDINEDMTKDIRVVAQQIKDEAINFLIGQYKIIFIYSIGLVMILLFYFKSNFIFLSSLCFLIGVINSMVCGYVLTLISMVQVKKLLLASNKGLLPSFKQCVNSSSKLAIITFLIAFVGYYVVVLMIYYFVTDEANKMFEILCSYGIGCSYTAFFSRISGGIFTKGADISCDIVGKIDNDLIENDFSNPSSIADNIGDIVGDLVGGVLDLIASLAETLAAVTVILSFFTFSNKQITTTSLDFIFFLFSLLMTSLMLFVLIEIYLMSSKKVFINYLNEF